MVVAMAYSNEIKDYAKELFLTVGSNGEHQYTFQDIRDAICQKFDDVKKLKRQTIQQWATAKDKITKKSWTDLWDKGQRHGVKKAIEDAERNIQADEELELQVDAITHARAERAIKLGKLVDRKLKNNEKLENIDLKILQTSELIFNNLNLESHIETDSNQVFNKSSQDKILEEEGYDESC